MSKSKNPERDAEIRRKYAKGKVSTYALAREYFLTESRIWQIVSGYDTNDKSHARKESGE